ncbi:hypothetical protein BVRB_6g138610 [Beta vulgaris subsp. vulgaris]|nr:hypothetical protein BVRB_6g138610 [Beta vulgaris subsp. vulgaris]
MKMPDQHKFEQTDMSHLHNRVKKDMMGRNKGGLLLGAPRCMITVMHPLRKPLTRLIFLVIQEDSWI